MQVAVAADDLTEVPGHHWRRPQAGKVDVVRQGLEAEYHVGRLAIPARHPDTLDDPAVGEVCTLMPLSLRTV